MANPRHFFVVGATTSRPDNWCRRAQLILTQFSVRHSRNRTRTATNSCQPHLDAVELDQHFSTLKLTMAWGTKSREKGKKKHARRCFKRELLPIPKPNGTERPNLHARRTNFHNKRKTNELPNFLSRFHRTVCVCVKWCGPKTGPLRPNLMGHFPNRRTQSTMNARFVPQKGAGDRGGVDDNGAVSCVLPAPLPSLASSASSGKR